MSVKTNRAHLDHYGVRDLAIDTWNDFEEFFQKYGGVQGGCWCMYYHRLHQAPGRDAEEKARNNHDDHKALVSQGRGHGILIYSGSRAVGWCQYGIREELPRPDNGKIYRILDPVPATQKLWRITCFFVDREYRRRGVAKIALKAALERIKNIGGGMVEAYPVTTFRTYSVWFGAVKMFEDLGFKPICALGKSNVLVRKMVYPDD